MANLGQLLTKKTKVTKDEIWLKFPPNKAPLTNSQ